MIILAMTLQKDETKTKELRAWQTINEVSVACLVLAVIYIAMGIFEGRLLIMEGLITGCLGLLLSKKISRAAALLLISISMISFSNGMVSWLGVVDFGERNILLACIGLWCGIRALKATILLRGTPTLDDILNRFVLTRN